MESNNIVRHTGRITQKDRWSLNNHQSVLLWLTGLPAAGKSTIAYALEHRLFQQGIRSYVLDGDNIRHGLNRGLGFTAADRRENLRRVGEVAKLFVDAGILTIAAFVSPYRADRLMIRELFGPGEMFEIHVKCSLNICEVRDPKGLYRKARNGDIPNFTGVSDPYEEPEHPDLVIETDRLAVNESVESLLSFLNHRGII